MLDNMRTASASTAGKFVMAFLFSLLAVAFGISFGPGWRGLTGSGSGPQWAAKVNGETIGVPEFERYYWRTVRRFGDMDRNLIDQYFPRSRALDELIADRLVAAEARRQGVAVGDRELADAITKNAAFQEDGRFSEQRYRLMLERSLGLTEQDFENEMRRGMLVGKMSALVRQTAKVTDGELEQQFRDDNEKVSLAFVRFAPAFYASQASPSDAEVGAFIKDHADQITAEYGKETWRYHLPRRVQARHLLFRVAAATDGTKAKEAALAARARAVKGEDFGALVKSLSQAGDAASGGELGEIREHDRLFDPALEQAALALAEGEVSEPVRSAHGWELVQAEKVLPAENKSLDQVRGDLAREMLTRQREGTLAKAAAEAAQAKLAAGAKLSDLFPPAAGPVGDEPAKFAPPPEHPATETTGLFARSAVGYVPKIGQSLPLQTAAFALATPGTAAKQPFQVGENWVVVQLAEHDAPDMKEFAKKKDELRENAQRQAEIELMGGWRKTLLSQAVIERNMALIAPQKPQS